MNLNLFKKCLEDNSLDISTEVLSTMLFSGFMLLNDSTIDLENFENLLNFQRIYLDYLDKLPASNLRDFLIKRFIDQDMNQTTVVWEIFRPYKEYSKFYQLYLKFMGKPNYRPCVVRYFELKENTNTSITMPSSRRNYSFNDNLSVVSLDDSSSSDSDISDDISDIINSIGSDIF